MQIRFLTATAAAALVVTGALVMPAVAHADTTAPLTSSTLVEEHGVALPVDGAVSVRYTTTPEGGGTWTYGTNGPNNTAFSNFHHKTRKHGSSVKNGRGDTVRSPDTAPDKTAKASIRKSYAGNSAYYRFVK